jgi:hypothetical protein
MASRCRARSPPEIHGAMDYAVLLLEVDRVKRQRQEAAAARRNPLSSSHSSGSSSSSFGGGGWLTATRR